MLRRNATIYTLQPTWFTVSGLNIVSRKLIFQYVEQWMQWIMPIVYTVFSKLNIVSSYLRRLKLENVNNFWVRSEVADFEGKDFKIACEV